MSKILIVEDDPLMFRMYKKIFTFEGFEVDVAADGEEGLKKAREWQPNIILLDMMMPKMNGLQVLDNLKSDPACRKTPVVVLTNLAGESDAEAAMSKGAVRYIIKSEQDPKGVANIVKEIMTGYTRNQVPGGGGAATTSPAPFPASPAPTGAGAPQPAAPPTQSPPPLAAPVNPPQSAPRRGGPAAKQG